MLPSLRMLAVGCSALLLVGCQSFLYPLVSDKDAIEEPRVEGKHDWAISGEAYEATITKVKPLAYKAVVTSPEGKIELLLQLTKIKNDIFFQLSPFPQEPAKQLDEQSGEGLFGASLIRMTQRPNYLVGKITDFQPRLRIAFFNATAASEKYFSKDLVDSYQAIPGEPGGSTSKPGYLVAVAPDKLRAFLERADGDSGCFYDPEQR